MAVAMVLGLAATLLPPPRTAHAATACMRDGRQLSVLDCSQILVTAPYALTFSGDAGRLADRNGIGTGFTMVDPPFTGPGYLPQKLAINTAAPGTLSITTDKGIAWLNENAQQNALGVGIRPGRTMVLRTTVIKPPKGTGKYEQAGLWWGNDQSFYVKLVIRSTPRRDGIGADLQLGLEVNDAESSSVYTPNLTGLDNKRVGLALLTDPAASKITASYTLDGGAPITVGSVDPPPGMFTADAAGIDPTIGTNTFGGIFATHRKASTARQYQFDDFSLDDVTPPPPPPPPGAPNFDRFAVAADISSPSAMAFGPDGRLYVAEMLGRIHALTLNAAHAVTDDQIIGDLGSRLTLGVAVDPASTPTNVILWVSHSDPTLSGPDPVTGVGGAPANSSAVAKITVNPATKTSTRATPDPISGLPRSQADHSTNGLAFGPVQPDGRRHLYIAQGGNTGAGAPNTSRESMGEFGTREEQPLSAAVLDADVQDPGFVGACANPTDIYAAAPCSVVPYATGLRNPFSLAWHSNGSLYAPDNGAAVGPTYPRSPTPACDGLSPYPANSPGVQDDLLYRVQPGRDYGHPDPHRLPTPQCVFKTGAEQGVATPAGFTPPIADLGKNKSADGIIEYTASTFNGALQGNLLITNYSVGDDITRVVLSPDGTSVVSRSTLASGFVDPLPLVQGPDGTLYVGEFGANKVTALVPTNAPPDTNVGSWTSLAPMPAAVLDAGGTSLGGKLYVVSGKTSAGYVRTLYSYDPATNGWSTAAPLPTTFAAVENPAVAAYGGKLYVFGGSTAPFSGSVTSAAVYDPATNAWTMLARLAVARGAATAQAIGSKIYVAGGTATNGASLASLEIYDPATNTWSTGAAMSTRRDNPGSAALGGQFYVFGGRTRNSDGTSADPGLATVESYDPATNAWTARASMPTGRRTMSVGTLNGKAQLTGGESSPLTTSTHAQHEEYDPGTDAWRTLTPIPTPRHGAVAGTIGDTTYVAGGSTKSGTFYSAVLQAFRF